MRKIFWIFAVLLIILSCKKDIEFDYPIVFTGDVTNINIKSATFSAKITNHGNFPITESGFIWGVHSNDNFGIKIINNETPDGVYSLQTNELLLPNKTFYVRAYVKTESTITFGKEVSFNSFNDDINIGEWLKIFNESGNWTDYITSSFTINNTTYILLWDGSFYSYDNSSNTFAYILSNDILKFNYFSTSYQDVGYIFSEGSFYVFEPSSLTFNKLAQMPVTLHRITGFLINDNLYIGLGYHNIHEYNKEFWKYNISGNTWDQIATFTGDERNSALSFCLNDIAYVCSGINKNTQHLSDLWSYDPAKDEWQRKKDLPNDLYKYMYCTNTRTFGYGLSNNNFFEYNPTFDFWEKMADINDSEALGLSHLFALEDKIYALKATEYIDDKFFQIWLYEK